MPSVALVRFPVGDIFMSYSGEGISNSLHDAFAREHTDVIEGAIDTTTATSFRFERMTGWDGKHKKIGSKISLFADKNGLPADVQFGKGSHHDGSFVLGHIKRRLEGAKECFIWIKFMQAWNYEER